MKVALLAPITWRTPLRNYGPWEQVVSVLAEALVKEGVDVTLFATGDSVTQAKLEYVWEKPLGEYQANAKVAECLHISGAMEKASEFDVIHNHFDFLPLTYSRLIATPFITTIHGFSSQEIIPVYKNIMPARFMFQSVTVTGITGLLISALFITGWMNVNSVLEKALVITFYISEGFIRTKARTRPSK